MQIHCFEDRHVDRLRPITLARPAYAITSASFRLIDWLRRLEGNVTASVRDYLGVIQKLDHELDSIPDLQDRDGVLLVNARLIPRVATDAALRSLAASDQSVVVTDPDDDGTVLAARVTAADLRRARDEIESASAAKPGLPAETRFAVDSLLQWVPTLPVAPSGPETRSRDVTEEAGPLTAFRWPHDVIAAHMRDMPESLRWRIDHGDYQQLQDGVFVGPGVKIGEYPSIHANEHPILLERDVSVGPFCFLEGPLYAGPGTRVIEHAAIKDGVSLGHTVKIGGEVEASVIEPYTNKQHHGFLGHSYLGSWINLGAGTCNSDLKNTYGTINVEYGDEKVATGMQFLGCVIGDYSKTAINTGIFTGKVIGVCSMLYGFVTSNVPSFVNYARLFGQTSLLPADIMINSQRRMFARRKVEQRECDRQLITDMYQRTRHERHAADQLAL